MLAKLTNFRNDEKALNFLEELNRNGEPVSTTVINMAELYRGAFSHPKTDEKLQEIDVFAEYNKSGEVIGIEIWQAAS